MKGGQNRLGRGAGLRCRGLSAGSHRLCLGGVGGGAAGHLSPFNLCVFGSYLTRNYSSVCIWGSPHIPPYKAVIRMPVLFLRGQEALPASCHRAALLGSLGNRVGTADLHSWQPTGTAGGERPWTLLRLCTAPSLQI